MSGSDRTLKRRLCYLSALSLSLFASVTSAGFFDPVYSAVGTEMQCDREFRSAAVIKPLIRRLRRWRTAFLRDPGLGVASLDDVLPAIEVTAERNCRSQNQPGQQTQARKKLHGMSPLPDLFVEGTEPADSDTFLIIYVDNYKPRSDGKSGHGLKVRYRPDPDIRDCG